jgi:membrane associated rhomboid family serine protease/Zn-finger nucleic acid-binding protein
MLVCPTCQRRLDHSKTELGHIYSCPQCEGRSASFAVVRRAAGRRYVNQLLRRVREGEGQAGIRCPSCAKAMVEVSAGPEQPRPVLDLCLECQFVWFDHDEFEEMPSLATEADIEAAIPPAAREAMALADIAIADKQARGADYGGRSPMEWWKWVPGFMGMPVEHDATILQRLPLVTWGLAIIMAVVTFLTIPDLEKVVNQFGLKPDQWDRMGGLTFLTSFFLHAGLFHLIGNAYFLTIFGDNVEDYLGRFRYILLIALAALAGDAVHIYFDQEQGRATVGASGGISGVVTYYALRFPRARLGIMLRYFILFKWLHMPAYFALILWFGLQLFGVWAQYQGITNVSSLAHLGGAAVGLLAWVVWRDS